MLSVCDRSICELGKLEFDEEVIGVKKLIALILALVCVVVLSSCETENDTSRETIPDSSVATFEYKDDDGYKLITSEISSLDTFDSLLLKPTDAEFTGEWIYRIVFNPNEYSNYTEEFIILFGEESVLINGKNYVGEYVPYLEILNWASAKYEFFDYELIKS